MNRLSSFRYALLGAASFLALAACGGISDPSKDDGDGTVATVSGALTGDDVPAGTHVAVVWRVGSERKIVVGSDAVVVNGSFTLNLVAPPSTYFFAPEDDGIESYSYFGDAPEASDGTGSSGSPPPSSADAGSGPIGEETPMPKESAALGSHLRPLDSASGTVSKPMRVAVAGFVVYVDTNGNGKLDIGEKNAPSTDEVIGGNDELALTFLQDGTKLDYERLRDRSGGVPAAGYNLVWLDETRWLPLNAVDLELDPKKASLPGPVCAYRSCKVGASSSDAEGACEHMKDICDQFKTADCSDSNDEYAKLTSSQKDVADQQIDCIMAATTCETIATCVGTDGSGGEEEATAEDSSGGSAQ